jgi:hypothetical protein
MTTKIEKRGIRSDEAERASKGVKLMKACMRACLSI